MSFKNRLGFGKETGYIYRLVDLRDAKKYKKLLAPHIEESLKKARPAIEDIGVKKYITEIYKDTPIWSIPEEELADAVRRCGAYFRATTGKVNEYLVVDALEVALKPHKIEVLTQVRIDGFPFDAILVPQTGEYRIDVEISRDAYQWTNEVTRHRGKPFFFINPGYDLTAPMVKEMGKYDCVPVFTVGCACKGPISFDQFVTEAPVIFKEAGEGTAKAFYQKMA